MPWVYILDDDDCALHSLQYLIETTFDVDLQIFSAAEDFYARADHLYPGALLVDHQMPKCSGIDVIRTLAHRADNRFATILMSGYLDTALIRAAFDAGAATVVEKPCSIKVLQDALKQSLARIQLGLEIRAPLSPAAGSGFPEEVATPLSKFPFTIPDYSTDQRKGDSDGADLSGRRR